MQTIRTSFVLSSALAAAVACSSGGGTNDGGTDSGGDGGGNTFTQTGQIIDYTSKSGVSGIIVSSGSTQATSDKQGNYTLSVPQNQPYTMNISSAPDASTSYLTLDEQEWSLTGNANRGQTSAVANTTESFLKNLLQPSPQTSLAVLSVLVEVANPDAGACTSATGATISVPNMTTDGGAGAKLVYFAGSPTAIPDPTAKSVTDGLLPSAIIYDLPPTASFNQITVTPPAGCTVKAFPTTDPTEPNIKYTGNVKLEASQTPDGTNVASFMRVFLQ